MATFDHPAPAIVRVRRNIRVHRSVQLGALLVLPLAWIVVFYLVPLAYLLLASFWQIINYNVAQVWTLENYQHILSQPVWLRVLLRTVIMAALVTLTTICLGLPLSYFLVRYTSRFRRLLYVAVLIPLWSSYLVRVFAWRTILGANGLLNTFLISLHIVDHPVQAFLYSNTAIYITFVYVWLPYMILPIVAALECMPRSLPEASADLGARGFITMRRVVLPLALPGILGGSIIVFSLSMGDFITPLLMGNGDKFIGNVIADQFAVSLNYPFGAALSVLLLAVLSAFLVIARRSGVLEAL